MEDRSCTYYEVQQKEKIENRFYIYLHRRATDNKVFYVGKGSGARAWTIVNRNPHWTNVYKKHGRTVEIVFDDLDEETAFQCEKDAILEFKYFGAELTNMSSGGDGCAGRIITEEIRKRMSEGQRNSEKVKLGRLKTAEKLRGRKVPEHHRKARAEALRGLKKTEDHKRNAGLARRDKAVYTFYHQTGVQFSGTRREISEHTGLPLSQVSAVINEDVFSSNGWAISQENFEKTRLEDLDVHIFYHRSGRTFEGTRAAFAATEGLETSRVSMLFIPNKPRLTVLDWALDPSNFTRKRKDSEETKKKKSDAKKGKNYGLAGENHYLYGKKRGEEFSLQMKEYWKNQPEITCPHCGKVSRFKPVMVRDHLDNCKHNNFAKLNNKENNHDDC